MFRFRCKYHRLRQLQALLHHYPPASMYSHSLHSPIADPGSDFYFTATNIEKPVLINYKKRIFLYFYLNIYWAPLDEYKSGCIICVLEREKEGRVVRLCLTGLTGSSARGESLGWSAQSLVVSSDQTIIKLWPGRARDGSDKKIQIFPHQSQSQESRQAQTVNPCPAMSRTFLILYYRLTWSSGEKKIYI